MIADRALALACELGERNGVRRCIEAGSRNYPDLGIDVRDIAGGIVTFSGFSGSLSEGYAIGVDAEVSAETVDEMTAFFRLHGCAARVTVSPVTNPDLAPLLARAGYVPIESQNTLVADLDALEPEHAERENGRIVATACYAFEEGCVSLFAASTLPSHRRQGWQRTMIRERLARAKDAGMHAARVSAVPLSDSERNFRALGFVPLYTRTTWELGR